MRTCLETGFYNEFPPVCKRKCTNALTKHARIFRFYSGIQCGYPADIPNGEYTLVNDSVGYLSRVVYSCFKGYEMIGRAQLACDIDERWNGPPPRCERMWPPTHFPPVSPGDLQPFNASLPWRSPTDFWRCPAMTQCSAQWSPTSAYQGSSSWEPTGSPAWQMDSTTFRRPSAKVRRGTP